MSPKNRLKEEQKLCISKYFATVLPFLVSKLNTLTLSVNVTSGLKSTGVSSTVTLNVFTCIYRIVVLYVIFVFLGCIGPFVFL